MLVGCLVTSPARTRLEAPTAIAAAWFAGTSCTNQRCARQSIRSSNSDDLLPVIRPSAPSALQSTLKLIRLLLPLLTTAMCRICRAGNHWAVIIMNGSVSYAAIQLDCVRLHYNQNRQTLHSFDSNNSLVILWYRILRIWIYCHRLRGSASTVLMATGQVNGRWRILTPHRIETHEPTATKFRPIDYVRERTP